MMGNTAPKTPEELIEASRHVLYEFAMLRETRRGIQDGLASVWLANAVLESFLLHFRSLVDFLYKPPTRGDDILACQFFSSEGQWEPPQGDLEKALKDAQCRAHKHLAHLTDKRCGLSQGERNWDFIFPLAQDMERVFESFLAAAPKEFLCEELQQLQSASFGSGNCAGDHRDGPVLVVMGPGPMGTVATLPIGLPVGGKQS